MPTLTRNAVAFSGDQGEPRVVIEYTKGQATVGLSCANGYATFRCKPVEGKFPNYANILTAAGAVFAQESGDPLSTSAINPVYLKGAADIALKFASKSISSFISHDPAVASVFTFSGEPNSMLIIMAVREDSHVSDSVVKLVGENGMLPSIRALRAHATRTAKLLESAKGSMEREKLEAKRDDFNARIESLMAAIKDAPKALAAPQAA